MLTIRFNRVGKKNQAYFRIALQEHTVAPGGRHVEILGSYDPHLKKAVLKTERIKYWVQKGAQISDSAYNLFIRKGVLEGKKRAVKIPKAPTNADTIRTNADLTLTNTDSENKKGEKEEHANNKSACPKRA